MREGYHNYSKKLKEVLQDLHKSYIPHWHNTATCDLQPTTAHHPIYEYWYFSSDYQRPDERSTDDCGGKTWVDGSIAEPTDRQASRVWCCLGATHFLAGFIAAAKSCLLHVVTCSCKSFNLTFIILVIGVLVLSCLYSVCLSVCLSVCRTQT